MLSRFFRSCLSSVRYAVVVAIIAAVGIVIAQRTDARVLAAGIGITAYPDGVAVVQLPYRRDGDPGTVTVLVDGQIVVRDMPAYPDKYGNDNYYFRSPAALGDTALVRVTFRSERIVQSVLTRVRVVRTRTDGVIAAADESAPTAAARAAFALAKAHAADGNLPADPLTAVTELKNEMRWTSSGVSPDAYVGGLNAWAAKKGLPMHTERVAGTGDTILAELAHALDTGGTAQAYIQYVRAGTVTGGHTVGVERVTHVGSDTFIGMRDSAGPGGTDVYPVRKGILVGYGFSDDAAVLGWGFVQTWNP